METSKETLVQEFNNARPKMIVCFSTIRRKRCHGGTATNDLREKTTFEGTFEVNQSLINSITTIATTSLQTVENSFGFHQVAHAYIVLDIGTSSDVGSKAQISPSIVIIMLVGNDTIEGTTNGICLLEKLLE